MIQIREKYVTMFQKKAQEGIVIPPSLSFNVYVGYYFIDQIGFYKALT